MGGRIEIYLDLASFYSYVAFKQLLDLAPLLNAHGVEVDIKPVLLGGINAGSGNRPPWTLPAKAIYGRYDAARAQKAIGLLDVSPPEDLMAVGHTVLPLRVLHYVKQSYPESAYLSTWHYLFQSFWGPRKRNLRNPAELAVVLSEIPQGYAGSGRATGEGSNALFQRVDLEKILAATQEEKFKDILKGTVKEALERGAFGAPWFWVTNSKGKTEPFFGSDRWHFVYEFLELPYQSVALLPPGGIAPETSKL